MKRCQVDNKPGYKYGDSGKCYPYTSGDESSRKAAYNKALKQGRAVEWRKRQAGATFIEDVPAELGPRERVPEVEG